MLLEVQLRVPPLVYLHMHGIEPLNSINEKVCGRERMLQKRWLYLSTLLCLCFTLALPTTFSVFWAGWVYVIAYLFQWGFPIFVLRCIYIFLCPVWYVLVLWFSCNFNVFTEAVKMTLHFKRTGRERGDCNSGQNKLTLLMLRRCLSTRHCRCVTLHSWHASCNRFHTMLLCTQLCIQLMTLWSQWLTDEYSSRSSLVWRAWQTTEVIYRHLHWQKQPVY